MRSKRVSKSNGKLYWYGMGSSALDESDASGNITNEYVFFAGKRIARRDSSGNVSYYFSDHLGSSRVVTNASGAIQDDSDFYPFGGERPIVSSSGNTYKFTGKERDSESGLDNFGARYYSSALGRFVTPDWSEAPSPVPYAHLNNPQTLNLYAYVDNNPINGIDADGHAAFTGEPQACVNNCPQPPPPPAPQGQNQTAHRPQVPLQLLHRCLRIRVQLDRLDQPSAAAPLSPRQRTSTTPRIGW